MSADIWALVRARSAAAHASGAMYRIVSEPFFVEDEGIEFVVRRAVDYPRQLAIQPKPRPGNPFADPEPDLLIGDVGPRHRALLNKYHVVENHLLLVTREFVDQEILLDLADFEALVRCLPGDGRAIAFYNGGRDSGASQPHKHLQVVTLPLSPHLPIPMAPRLVADPPRLPFAHAFARLDDTEPARLFACYRELLARAGVSAVAAPGGERQSQSYNMLLGPGWMLVVPRTRDRFEGVPINSIAFAGGLFVRDDRELEAVRELGPMKVLEAVTRAA
jgi:ATP adenylyltransferase